MVSVEREYSSQIIPTLNSTLTYTIPSDEGVNQGWFHSKYPVTPGHEIVGDVVAIHSSVSEYKVGDRVGVPWIGGHCGSCRNCVVGKTAGCENGWQHWTGR